MDNKEIILKIYKAILNGEVEIENLNILFTDGIVLHITGKENTDFKEYIDNLSKKLHYDYVNYREQNYYKRTDLPFEKKPKEPKHKRYTYLMYDEISEYYKIGKSINPEFREKTLSSQTPKIRLIYKCKEAVVSEDYLHKLFQYKRIRGEWFDLNTDELDVVLNLMYQEIDEL
jgi:hypothetical protein